jgi:hypothetical protein
MDEKLRKSMGDALHTAREQTGLTADELFSEAVKLTSLAPPAGYCCGIIEGAAQAMNVTVLELLDELGLK